MRSNRTINSNAELPLPVLAGSNPARPRAVERLALLGFLVAGVVVVLLATLSLRIAYVLLQGDAAVALSYRMLADLEQLRSTLADMESAERDFVITGDDKFLLRYEHELQSVHSQFAAVKTELDRARVAGVEQLERALADKLTFAGKAIDIRRSRGEQAALRFVKARDDQRLTLALAQGLDTVGEERERLIAELNDERTANLRKLWIACALLLSALTGILTLLYRVIRRSQENARRALTSLRESEARFRSLVDMSSDWYWEQDEHLRFTSLSKEADRKSGFPGAGTPGRKRWDRSGLDATSPEWQAHKALCEAHQPFRDFVYQRVGADGKARWISVSGEAIFDAGGRFTGYRGTGKDVTERVRSEQRILRLNAFYQALSATNEAVVRAKDRDSLFGEVCRILVEHGGMSLAWVGQLDRSIQRVALIVSHGPDENYRGGAFGSADPSLPEGRGPMGLALRSGQVQVANDLLNDPRMLPWRAQLEKSGFRSKAVVPLKSGDETGMLLQLYSQQPGFFDAEMVELLARMGNDLSYALDNLMRESQRERAVAALAASEERFQLAVRGTNDGIFDLDMTTGASYFSPRFKDLLGYREDELEPGLEFFEIHLHPDDREPMAAAMREHLQQRTAHQAEYRLRTKTGQWRWFQSRGQATWDDDGHPVRFTGAIRDITERRAAEQQVERLRDLYAALSGTNQAIVHLRDPQQLLDAICRIAVEHGHFLKAWISMLDGGSKALVAVASAGSTLDEVRRIPASVDPALPEGQGYAAQVMATGRHVVVNDYLADERVRLWWDIAREHNMRSMGNFPLFRGAEPVGVLILWGRDVGFFTDQLVDLLVEMANDISFALDNFQREAEREAAERALKQSEEKFRLLAANVPEVFWINEPGYAGVSYVSPAYEQIWGRSAQQLLEHARDWIDAVHPEDRARVENTLRTAPKGQFDHEYRILRPNGEVRWIHDRSFPVMDPSGEVARITGVAEDITARKEAEERLLYLAHYDNLTHLPNRLLFYDRLQQSLAHSKRDGRSAAVVFLDLDRFKLVNDTLGHAAGDLLLQQVARRVADTLRPGDTVGRLGGDEFAVILSDLANADDASSVVQRMMRALEEPFSLDGHEIFVTASAGITLYPNDSEDPDTLIKNADAAMYRAKELGRSNHQFYKAEMNARSHERLSLENHLRRALDRDEFVLYYQPKVDLASGGITGVEALLRWRHPELGLVSPAHFIPILEENGTIVQVGEWVLAEACRQLNAWSAEGLVPVPVAVNLSGRQLQQKDLQNDIREILAQAGIEPRLIELEITESVLMRNPEHATGALRRLRDMGVRLSVDDFGTGYSSLSYLKSFPLDTLKIDRSFVRDITANPEDALITRAVISMAHSLRLRVVAEGVETDAQLAYLSANGCDEMQGFHFSPPVSAPECARLLRERRQMQIPERGSARERTLLLVDDEPSILASLKRLLRRDGYRVLLAGSAAQALDLLAGNEVSVVISDERMPGITGTELLRRVKDLYPETVRIILSGYTDLQTVTDAINQGAVYKFFTKPWDDEQLRANVKEAFAHKALQDENREQPGRAKPPPAKLADDERPNRLSAAG